MRLPDGAQALWKVQTAAAFQGQHRLCLRFCQFSAQFPAHGPHQTPPDGRILPVQHRDGQDHRAVCRLRHKGLRLPAEMAVLLTQQLRRRRDPRPAARRDLLQQGQDLQPQAVADIRSIPVALVLHIRNFMPCHIPIDLPPAGLQQGADDPPSHRRDAPKSLEARPPQEMEEDRFGIVLPVVGGSGADRAHVTGGSLQKSIAQSAGRVLNAQSLTAGKFPHIPRPAGQGNTLLPAPVPDKSLIPVRCGPQPVVEVGGSDLKAPFLRQLGQNVQQSHGVPPAGESAQHGPLPGQQVPLLAESADLSYQWINHLRHSAFPKC